MYIFLFACYRKLRKRAVVYIMKNIDLIELVISITLASFGGIVNRLVELEKDPTKNITLKQYIGSAFISLFVGIVIYSFFKHYDLERYFLITATAISGFIGSPIIDIVFSHIIQKKR